MEIHSYLAKYSSVDSILSAYKSDEDDFLWIGGPDPCDFLPVEVSVFSWKPYYFILCFGRKPVPFLLPKGQEF